MPWLFYAILSYALYSVTNFIDKFLVEKQTYEPVTLIILGGFLSFFVALLLFVWKGFPVVEQLQIFLLILIGILLSFYCLPYFKALLLEDTSRVVPLFQFFPIFVLVLSYIFLKQTLTANQLLGFGFITAGGFILGSERLSIKVFRLRKSFWYMMLSSFLYALTSILFKFVTVTDFWVSMSYQTLGITLGAFLLLLFKPYRRIFLKDITHLKKKTAAVLAVSQCITLGADFSYFFAITLASAALVSVMQGTQPVFVMLYGLLLTLFFPKIIKEDISRKTLGIKIAAIFILFVGIVLIYY